MEGLQYCMSTLIGPLYLVASQDGLKGVFFTKQPVRSIKDFGSTTKEGKILRETAKQLEEYFKGDRREFDLALHYSGTPFQTQVWQALTKIPFGRTVSYSDIAQKIKNPRAVRAVGSANGKNPFCVIIPCHRVIAADGSIGGYSGGISIKQALLKLESNPGR